MQLPHLTVDPRRSGPAGDHVYHILAAPPPPPLANFDISCRKPEGQPVDWLIGITSLIL
jgi:hypothetical protein